MVLKTANAREVFLTFDVEGPASREDYMDSRTLWALTKILNLLEKYRLKAIFFVTGSVVKEIERCPEVLEMMRKHEIGYHSSSHSVRPMIFEYTDIKSYDKAVQISLARETSDIDPSTGKPKGEGGILSLREIFYDKKIVSFRAPFLCWSPPHLDAMKRLGLNFDFSADLEETPALHMGITFYPHPLNINKPLSRTRVLPSITTRKYTSLLAHPADFIFRKSNCYAYRTRCPAPTMLRSISNIRTKFASLELFFHGLSIMNKARILQITPPLKEGLSRLSTREENLARIYSTTMWAPRELFCYKPKFLLSHFHRFLTSSI